jgi:geranylgeranyl diphosphate synthase type I
MLFEDALKVRRDLVYDYLEAWPGSDNFRPDDIHHAIFSYVRQRGKGLRPMLLLLCCGAAGGDEYAALPAAAAVEVFQIWTLVHDDIIDRDEMRRGHPTIHAEYARRAREVMGLRGPKADHYGLAVATLTGDLQQSWAYSMLADLEGRGVELATVLKLVARMSGTLTPRLLEGEMLDVQYSEMPPDSLSETDILHMLSSKTAALLEYAAWAGASIGLNGADDAEGLAERLAKFASLCGTAFQLQDDLLGLTADSALLGKPVGSDVREGKRTLILFRALQRLRDAKRDTLLATVGNSEATEDEIAVALELIAQTGALDDVRELANWYISQAHNELQHVPAGVYKDLLGSWADFVTTRSK